MLQTRRGGVVKVEAGVLMSESRYKCLYISEETDSAELVALLLRCYGLDRIERPERFALYEQCSSQR